MKRIIILLVTIFLIGLGSAWYFLYFKRNADKGALQVTSFPKSKVYIDGKFSGITPFCKCPPDVLPIGEYRVKLEPQEGGYSSYEEKVIIVRSVLTVLDRTFAKGAEAEGHTITLNPLEDKKRIEFFVSSFPSGATVLIDKNQTKATPMFTSDITDSDHEVLLKKEGYKDKAVRIHTIPGYKLSIIAYLGIDINTKVASPSPTASPSAMPSQAVIVSDTPTGFLNVRESASVTSKKIGTVTPGDSLELVSEEDGWFRVKISDGTEGFISAQYAKKKE